MRNGLSVGLDASGVGPLVLLIGGTTGTGKSTLAADVAHRLGITRVSSTDFIRQTMRVVLSKELAPAIHSSSFDAGDVRADLPASQRVVAGFVEQCRFVGVGIDAAVRRAVVEGWPMVLEGVHVVPGLVGAEVVGGTVVQVVTELPARSLHVQRFVERDRATGSARAKEKYLTRFEEIRSIQKFVVSRAREEGVPVIDTSDRESACAGVLACLAESVGAR